MKHSSPRTEIDDDIEVAQKIADELKAIYHEDFVASAETTQEIGDFHMVTYTDISITVMAPDTSFLGQLFQNQVKVTVLHYVYPAQGSFDWNKKYPEVKTLFEKYHKLRK